MPHLIIECSDNLRAEVEFKSLFPKIHQYLAGTKLFPLGGIRSRVHFVDVFEMADGKGDYAFIHFELQIGHGRSLNDRKRVGEAVFELITLHFNALYARRLLALSFQISEIDPDLNYKQNNIHALFQTKETSC